MIIVYWRAHQATTTGTEPGYNRRYSQGEAGKESTRPAVGPTFEPFAVVVVLELVQEQESIGMDRVASIWRLARRSGFRFFDHNLSARTYMLNKNKKSATAGTSSKAGLVE